MFFRVFIMTHFADDALGKLSIHERKWRKLCWILRRLNPTSPSYLLLSSRPFVWHRELV